MLYYDPVRGLEEIRVLFNCVKYTLIVSDNGSGVTGITLITSSIHIFYLKNINSTKFFE